MNGTVVLPTRDTYIFSPRTNHFYRVNSPPEMENRSYAAVAYVERPSPQADLLFLYGGGQPRNGSQLVKSCLNDLWVLDTHMAGKKKQKSDLRSWITPSKSLNSITNTCLDPNFLDTTSLDRKNSPVLLICITVVGSVLFLLIGLGTGAFVIWKKKRKSKRQMNGDESIRLLSDENSSINPSVK